jgi:regulator of cell morphogenesis and NO signaling
MDLNNKTLIGNIVAKNYKSASVFKSYGIDFCCNGNRSIEKVCEVNDIDENELIDLLKNCFETETDTNDYQSWEIDFLSDYIYNKHHKYIENKVPEIKQYLDKICRVHGNSHPELLEINKLFKESASDLILHMKKEELILFPYFKKLAAAVRDNTPVSSPQFDTVKSPIAMMHEEHDNEGHRFRKISELSNDYKPPIDACSSYKVSFSLLKEFEDDLHKHIHLENNILFKKGIELEQKLQEK